MNYQITCVCGHRFLINDEQLAGHVTCPACKRALSPVVSPPPAAPGAPESAPAVATAASAENREVTVSNPAPEPTKRCPFCGEVILEIAKKCKHCGEFLDRAAAVTAGQAVTASAPATLPAEEPPVFDLTVSQWDNFWRFIICAVIAAAVSAGLIILLPMYAAIGVPATLVIMAFIAWFFYISTRNSRCIIRPMRIETEVGVLSKDLNAVDLFRVTDLELKQGLVERILGIGTIRVLSNDQNTPELILYEIPQAKKVYKYLQQQVPIAARQRGAVYMER